MEITKVLDPVVNFDIKPHILASVGGADVNFATFPSTSYSSTQVIFDSISFTSREVATSRLWIMKFPLKITFTGTTTDGSELIKLGTDDALRAWPINSVVQNASLSIGNQNITMPISTLISAITSVDMLYEQKLQLLLESSPTLHDQFQDYAVPVGGPMNPLGSEYSSSGFQHPRGAYNYNVLSNGSGSGNLTSVINVDIYEPVLISPLLQSYDYRGLINLSSDMRLQLQMDNLMQRIWSHNQKGVSQLSSVVVSFNSPPELFIHQINPQPDYVIPDSVDYGLRTFYYQYQVGKQLGTYGSSSDSTTINTNTFTLEAIPSKLLIFARRTDSDLAINGWQYTDTFAAITSISLNFGPRTSLLANATQYDLWRMSVESGWKYRWHESSGKDQCGQVLVLTPGRSFPLPEGLSVGVSEFTSVQFKLGIQNLSSSDTTTFDVYMLAVYPGQMSISKQRGTQVQNYGVINKEQVKAAQIDDKLSALEYEKAITGGGIAGGSIFSSIASFFRSLPSLAKKAIGKVEQVLPHVKRVVEALPSGSGRGGRMARVSQL